MFTFVKYVEYGGGWQCMVPSEDIFKDSAWCYTHNRECPLGFSDCDLVIRPFKWLVDVSGTSCTDESSMGQRLRYRGKTALSFAVWLTEMKFFHHAGIQEITALFQPRIFERLLPEFETHSMVFTPTSFGLPYSRPRKYTLLLRKTDLTLCRPLEESEPEKRLLFFPWKHGFQGLRVTVHL